MNFDLPPDWPKHVAGPGGAALALYWLKGGGWHKLFGFVVGSALSIVGPDSVSRVSGLDYGFSAFLLGMFGFSVISKGFETIQAMKAWPILKRWLEKRLKVEETQ